MQVIGVGRLVVEGIDAAHGVVASWAVDAVMKGIVCRCDGQDVDGFALPSGADEEVSAFG